MLLSYRDIFEGVQNQISAEITTDHSESSYGQPVIILETGELLDAASWLLMSYEVVIASEEEYTLLRKWISTLTFLASQGDVHDMTVSEAAIIAGVTDKAIRLAADRGDIPGARKLGRDWLIPYDGLNHFLDHRPKPGRH